MTIPVSNGTPSGATSKTRTPAGSGTGTPTSLYANYANYVSQVLLADTVGSIAAIPNALAAGQLDTAILVDPAKIQAYRDAVGDQLNSQTIGPTFTDLSDRIADIVIETVVQGAGTLEVHIIDPLWTLLTTPDSKGNLFISTDANGYLWPPVDINFPTDTDCHWRLCQVAASLDFTQPNIKLTFEDRIASLLRELSPGNGGIYQGLANQTLGGFIQMLIDSTNSILKPTPKIRLVELIDPQDPNYTVPITQVPKSATGKLRKQPNKTGVGLSIAQAALIAKIDGYTTNGVDSTSMAAAEAANAGKLAALNRENGSSIWDYEQVPLNPGNVP